MIGLYSGSLSVLLLAQAERRARGWMRARVSATLLLISQILNSSLVDVRTAVLPWSARVGFLASLAETFTRARRSMTRMSDLTSRSAVRRRRWEQERVRCLWSRGGWLGRTAGGSAGGARPALPRGGVPDGGARANVSATALRVEAQAGAFRFHLRVSLYVATDVRTHRHRQDVIPPS